MMVSLFDDDSPGHLVRDHEMEALVSGRIGPTGNRTFHCHFSSSKAGEDNGAIDYVVREEEYDGHEDDLEVAIGDADDVRDACDAVDASVRIRVGRTAERINQKTVVELPWQLDRQGRENVARAFVKDWNDRGHQAVAAVHFHKTNPHLHVVATSRPVMRDPDGGWTVDRDPAKRVTADRNETKAERRRVADLVNHEVGFELFHPGRLKDTGITDRPPKTREKSLWENRAPFTPEQNAAYGVEQRRKRAANAERIAEEKRARLKRRNDLERKKLGTTRKQDQRSIRILEHRLGQLEGIYETDQKKIEDLSTELVSTNKLKRQMTDNRDQIHAELNRVKSQGNQAKIDEGTYAEPPTDAQKATIKKILPANRPVLLREVLRRRNILVTTTDGIVLTKGLAGQVIGLDRNIAKGAEIPLPGMAPVQKPKGRGQSR